MDTQTLANLGLVLLFVLVGGVFAGTEHGMEAQKPEVLDVASMNKKNTRTA